MAGSTPASHSADLAAAGDPAFLGLDPAPAAMGSELVSDGTAAVASAYPALAASVLDAPPVDKRRSGAGEIWFRFSRHRLALASTVVLAALVLGVVLGPFLWRTAIDDIDFAATLQGPTAAHPFGTDDLGQDLLARMIYGGRISLSVGVAAMLVATTVGLTVGSLAGMSRGALGPVLMWVTDLFLALPQLPLLLLLIYLFRDNLKRAFGVEGGVFVMIVLVIGGLGWMPVARLVRAQFLSLREKEFVEAARSQGGGGLHLVLRHILPNALGPVIVAGTIEVSSAIIAESTLSFLGLGFPPDIPTWGRILFDAKDHLDVAPHWALFPGLAIFLTVLSINFIGDGLRDALDARRVV
jgi:peptide/nickel transport system permease protein